MFQRLDLTDDVQRWQFFLINVYHTQFATLIFGSDTYRCNLVPAKSDDAKRYLGSPHLPVTASAVVSSAQNMTRRITLKAMLKTVASSTDDIVPWDFSVGFPLVLYSNKNGWKGLFSVSPKVSRWLFGQDAGKAQARLRYGR